MIILVIILCALFFAVFCALSAHHAEQEAEIAELESEVFSDED